MEDFWLLLLHATVRKTILTGPFVDLTRRMRLAWFQDADNEVWRQMFRGGTGNEFEWKLGKRNYEFCIMGSMYSSVQLPESLTH